MEERARKVNSTLGRNAVQLLGEMVDPRVIYDAADIVVGMGGSALRGMAFGKPVIIVGEGTYSRILTPETAREFLYFGIYGTQCRADATDELATQIRSLVVSPERRRYLGTFSRDFVVSNFALNKISDDLNRYLHMACAHERPLFGTAVDAVRMVALRRCQPVVPRFVRKWVHARETRQVQIASGSAAGFGTRHLREE
jgi:hypothetical protein